MTANQTFRGKVDLAIAGAEYFKQAAALTVTTPGVEQTLISEIVDPGKTVNLLIFHLTCNTQGSYKIELDGALIGSGRTGSGSPNSVFKWKPFKVAIAGETIIVKYTQITGRASSNIEAYLQGREI